MANKLHSDTGKPTFETVSYAPSFKNTGDLEAATKTITATSEGAVADYSWSGTLPAPADARFAILRIASRFTLTIDSATGTPDLRCRVYVDAQAANNMLYDLTLVTTGAQVAVQDCLVGTKETIFNLLKDGASHTLYFFFWTPGSTAPVISLVTVMYGIGATGSAAQGWGVEVFTFTDTLGGGLMKFGNMLGRAGGAGNIGCAIMYPAGTPGDRFRLWNGTSFAGSPPLPINGAVAIRFTDLVTVTDLWYLPDIGIHIMRF